MRNAALPTVCRCLLVLILGALLGVRCRRWLYRHVLGYSIDSRANIGIIYLRVIEAELGPDSRIGHFSVIRNLHRLELSANASIGTFNWVFGMLDSGEHFVADVGRRSELIMERDSALTSRHIIDCTNTVCIGSFSTIAGFNCQLLTHGINIVANRQESAPIIIGKHCLVGSACIILKGSIIPDGSVIGAGSVFRGQPSQGYQLYSGVPAKPIKALPHQLAYFIRETGAVR
ncbi:acyltransferase [Pseudorhodoplanes sp.]|uniref:acyltransferase n=1 Tax=Pseudorhodoplanes sp. TaxID=1934341 RepID=UPI003D0DBD43